jgi:hypothetical protein
MDKINTEIEMMADKMEKAVVDPQDRLFTIIKSLGPEGLKARLPELSEEEKIVLKSALEEMTLKKAVEFDKEAAGAKFIQGKVTDTIIQEDKADDDADEKLVKPEAAKMNHQGTPTDGWEGQVVKSEIEMLEENIDEVIEKAMARCNDEKKVMTKLKEKGMGEEKVQGALDKFKMKKAAEMSKEEAKDKIMSMEEKEHGTKDPKKLVEAEKKENMKENMKKSLTWDDETRLLKANTGGRNFNFNLENFIEETLKNETTEEVKKSESNKEDLNDIIEKSKDRNWQQVNSQRSSEEHKTNGAMYKSFEDKDLAEILGLTEEEAKKILG